MNHLDDTRLALLIEDIRAIMEKAGARIILPAFSRAMTSRSKLDGSVVTETDLACQQAIEAELGRLDADISFIGEEMDEADQMACLEQGRYWCVDPLDGTSNFISGIPVFASSLALIEDGMPLLACIHDPIRRETFCAIRHRGASLNGRPLSARSEGRLDQAMGYIDFKRLDAKRKRALLKPGLYRSQRNIGSCALEWAWLAAGRGHFIIHGGEKLWDFAAGALLAAEAGCVVSNFDGHPLFPCPGLSSPILAAANAGLHAPLLALL